MGDNFSNYFKKSDKVNMKSIITLYGTKVFCPNEEMQISASAKTHIDYLFSRYKTNGNEICFNSLYKTDNFASLVVTF